MLAAHPKCFLCLHCLFSQHEYPKMRTQSFWRGSDGITAIVTSHFFFKGLGSPLIDVPGC